MLSIQQKFLLNKAEQYTNLGYKVGFTLAKGLVGEYRNADTSIWAGLQSWGVNVSVPKEWDGISLLLEDMICVDFDVPDLNLGWHYLPPTLKERTPHGYHLFYLVPPDARKLHTKIKWRPNVDLLVKEKSVKRTAYKDDSLPWSAHALCSPTPGYTRVYPDEMMAKSKLTLAPDWLMEALEK